MHVREALRIPDHDANGFTTGDPYASIPPRRTAGSDELPVSEWGVARRSPGLHRIEGEQRIRYVGRNAAVVLNLSGTLFERAAWSSHMANVATDSGTRL